MAGVVAGGEQSRRPSRALQLLQAQLQQQHQLLLLLLLQADGALPLRLQDRVRRLQTQIR